LSRSERSCARSVAEVWASRIGGQSGQHDDDDADDEPGEHRYLVSDADNGE
jgi:hypothetical protein